MHSTDSLVYRDDRQGAAHRRAVLAEERRVQLALMPLSLSHVFAHRVGRAAAGGMAIACAGVLALMAADPTLLRMLSWFFVGLVPSLGMCAAVCAAAILAAYALGSAVAAHVFARRMREAIETHDDVYGDLDQLARGPLERGHQLVRRADGWAVGLVVAGAGALTAVFGYLVVLAGLGRPLAWVLASPQVFSLRLAAENAALLGTTLALAVAAGVVIGRACDREHRAPAPPAVTRWLGRWLALPVGVVAGLVTLYGVFQLAAPLYASAYVRVAPPPHAARLAFALTGVTSVIVLAAWAALWWRRREHARLGR